MPPLQIGINLSITGTVTIFDDAPPPAASNILLESGDAMLLESGDKILQE
jgi:hypothetical protein